MSQTPVFPSLILKALKNLNVEKAQNHSVLDHHTPGLNYLNLQRSDNFTLKLYLIEEQVNNNAGYLVHPHSHRYDFSTTVLAGRISNVIFDDVGTKPHKSEQRIYEDEIAGGADFAATRYDYSFERGIGLTPVSTWLDIDTGRSAGYSAGSNYFVGTKQIHTLVTWPEPTLLCLSQFADIKKTSSVYMPVDNHTLVATGRKPTLDETEALRLRCIELLEGGFNG